MAKRYMTYEELSNVAGYYKPRNTMGSHDMIVTRHNGELTVIGSNSGWAVVEPGDTLGYDRGHVWVLPRPEEFRNPIRQVLAKARKSQRLLEYTSKDVVIPEGYYYHREFFHRYTVKTLGHAPRARGMVRGGDAVVISYEAQNSQGYCSGISRIVVRPTADRVAVAAWLARLWEVDEM